MKKYLKSYLFLLVFSLITIINAIHVHSYNVNIELKIGSKYMYVNNQPTLLDSPPIIINNRTAVPLRAILESLDCSVSWIGNEKKIVIQNDTNIIYLWIDNIYANFNGKTITLDFNPYINNHRTMVPLRFIFESMNYNVQWDNENKKITILKESKDENKVENIEQYKSILKNALENFQTSIDIEVLNYGDGYSLDIIETILNENPTIDYGYKGAHAEILWYEGNKNRTMKISFEYYFTKDEMEFMKESSIKKTKSIINSIIDDNMSNYEKELAIHDYIVNNARYDRSNINQIPPESYTDYGILINKVGVCEGYAKAFIRLLNIVGISNKYVVGIANNQPHAWVLVFINNSWQHVDITWDDPVTYDGSDILRYDYFNISSSQIESDHIWERELYPN